ncbi:MAG: GTP-binding protein [bacterium]
MIDERDALGSVGIAADSPHELAIHITAGIGPALALALNGRWRSYRAARGVGKGENRLVAAAQILFVDTPGIHKARDVMNARMVDHAMASLADPDAILFMVDAAAGLNTADREIAALLPQRPIIVGLNKIDTRSRVQLLPLLAEIGALLPDRAVVPCSARSGDNLDELLRTVVAALPGGGTRSSASHSANSTEVSTQITARFGSQPVRQAARRVVPPAGVQATDRSCRVRGVIAPLRTTSAKHASARMGLRCSRGGDGSATTRSRSVTNTVSPRAARRTYSLSLFLRTLRPTARTRER